MKKTVYREYFKMILASQFPERQLLEDKKIFQCIKLCFRRFFFSNVDLSHMVFSPVNIFFFRSQQYQEMSSFYSQILTSSYWIGSMLSKMQLTDWYVFVLAVTFIS